MAPSLTPHPAIETGRRVRVRSGPFRGLEGLVSGRSGAERLILQVRMLGSATSLELDGSLLDPID